ncbi:Site-specific recombinase, phage integrase family protein [Sulfitobacter noctilucae]|uniref:hypothetical protein n=1 Tax=Sulfitobacter noctilucae TaxID=1342302 RepID=UPI0012681BDA|nr:hypothetical protein [Sulfitobacter noctilucae]KIN65637.1 Site-specific recombinase, phage integrase family protein [Sulfitobacter noctilucae]
MSVIEAMYKELEGQQTLGDIWTLMHHTGAQNAEILGLKRKNLFLDNTIPHGEFTPDGLRTLKTASRRRKVPLVGRALEVAQRLASTYTNDQDLFPKYADTAKHDNFSQVMRKRLRKFTTDKKHAVYSLRHNMKDSLIKVNAGHRVELSILGHGLGKGSEASYGSGVSLEAMLEAMNRIDFGQNS